MDDAAENVRVGRIVEARGCAGGFWYSAHSDCEVEKNKTASAVAKENVVPCVRWAVSARITRPDEAK